MNKYCCLGTRCRSVLISNMLCFVLNAKICRVVAQPVCKLQNFAFRSRVVARGTLRDETPVLVVVVVVVVGVTINKSSNTWPILRPNESGRHCWRKDQLASEQTLHFNELNAKSAETKWRQAKRRRKHKTIEPIGELWCVFKVTHYICFEWWTGLVDWWHWRLQVFHKIDGLG